MDEDISTINTNRRNEKIFNLLINNKEKLIICFSAVILLIFSYFIFSEIKSKNKIKIADRYNIIKIFSDFEG